MLTPSYADGAPRRYEYTDRLRSCRVRRSPEQLPSPEPPQNAQAGHEKPDSSRNRHHRGTTICKISGLVCNAPDVDIETFNLRGKKRKIERRHEREIRY